MSSRSEPVRLADIGLVFLVLVTIGIVYLAFQTPGGSTSTATDSSPSPAPAPTTEPTEPAGAAPDESGEPGEPLMVVLGDSFSNGGEEYDGATWPEIVADDRGWTVEVSAPGGSGYVNPGDGRPMPERVASVIEDAPDADLWVLAAGASDVARDVGVADVVAAASEVLDGIGAGSPAPVVLVSPFAVAAPEEQTLVLRDELRALCAAAERCTFVDATSWFDRGGAPLMDPDGLNPTQLGQRRLAREMLAVLPQLA